MIELGIGLVLGVVTTYFFERRSARETEEHNRQLEAELTALRTSVYSVGAASPSKPKTGPDRASLADELLDRARSVQDAEGRLSRTSLTSYFFARGHRLDDVEQAIAELCTKELVRPDGKWLEIP